MFEYVNNQKGSAFAYVLIILVVLALLSTTLLNLSNAETRFTIRNERMNEAQNVARGGADTLAYYILYSRDDVAADFRSEASPPDITMSDSFNNGEFTVTARKLSQDAFGADQILIESEGVVDPLGKRYTRKVSLLLKKMSVSDVLNGIRQTGEGSLDLSAMPITFDTDKTPPIVQANLYGSDVITLHDDNKDTSDDLYVESIVNNSNVTPIDFRNDHILNKIVPKVEVIAELTDELHENYNSDVKDLWEEVLDLPNPPKSNIGSLAIFEGNYNLENAGAKHDEIVEKGFMTLVNNDIAYIVDVRDKDCIIYVEKIDVKQTVYIIGDHDFHLYVKGDGSGVAANFQTPEVFSVEKPEEVHAFIYINEGETMEIQANVTIDAYIKAPHATVLVDSNKTTINGAIIGDVILRNASQGAKGNFHFVPLGNEQMNNFFDDYHRYYLKN